MESVYTRDLKSLAERLAGSSPAPGTIQKKVSVAFFVFVPGSKTPACLAAGLERDFVIFEKPCFEKIEIHPRR